jgi:lantibiotic modifying enzyme
VRIHELLPDDPAVMGELDAALRAVCVSLQAPVTPGVTDFSLCHGVLGNAEMLLLVADALGREDIREGARTVGRLGVELYHRKGLPWPCGVMGAGEAPGLLLGTAGIGTFYLRLHDTRAAPSPLLVRPAGADHGTLQGEKEEV